MSVLPHEGTYPIMYGSYGVPVGSGYRRGYLARPDQAGTFPAVLVVPGRRGLTSHVKDLCRRLARWGFAALALDLRRVAEPAPEGDPEEGRVVLAGGEDRLARTDIDEAYEFVMSPDIAWSIRGQVGLLGLDGGGRSAILYAADQPSVRAVAIADAPLTSDPSRDPEVADALGRIACPLLGLFAATDQPAPHAPGTASWVVYEGVQPGFLDDALPGYDPGAAADALSRIVRFFETTLPAAQVLNLG